LVFEGEEVAGEEEAGGAAFEEPEDGEVVDAADVNAEVEFARGIFVGGEIEGRVFVIGVFGGGEEVPREEGGGFVGGVAEVFLLEGFLVGAGGADEVEVGGVVEGAAGVVGGEFGLEFGEEAVVERVLQSDAMEGEVFGVAAVAGFDDELVEIILRAAVGGEDFELAAPSDAGVGDGVEVAGVGVEGKFVEDAGAAFAGLGVGVGGEGVEGGAVDEGEGEGGGAKIFGKDGGAGGASGLVEDAGEFAAVFEEEAGLDFVAGGDPGVEAGGGFGLAADEGVGGGPGHADLAGFFEEFEAGAVGDPAALVGEEEHGGRRRD